MSATNKSTLVAFFLARARQSRETPAQRNNTVILPLTCAVSGAPPFEFFVKYSVFRDRESLLPEPQSVHFDITQKENKTLVFPLLAFLLYSWTPPPPSIACMPRFQQRRNGYPLLRGSLPYRQENSSSRRTPSLSWRVPHPYTRSSPSPRRIPSSLRKGSLPYRTNLDSTILKHSESTSNTSCCHFPTDPRNADPFYTYINTGSLSLLHYRK